MYLPALRNAAFAMCSMFIGTSLVAQEVPLPDGDVACIGCKDDLTKPSSSSAPQSAAGSWSLHQVTGWNKLKSEPGTCGPITPGPGCQIGKKCKLTTTGGTFSMQLRSQHPGGGGTTGPTPGKGWGLPDPDHSPLRWTFTVSSNNPKEVGCNGKLDLSIKWKQSGTEHVWTFKLTCSKCPNAEGNEPDEVPAAGTTGD